MINPLLKIFFLLILSCVTACNSSITINQKSAKKPLAFESFSTSSSGFSCGVSKEKKLLCAGLQLRFYPRLTEFSHPSNLPVKLFELARYHTCAVFTGAAADEVWCAGRGTSGELGNGIPGESETLVKVSHLPTTRFLDLGMSLTSSCVLTQDQEIYCWGKGHLGHGSNTTELIPVKIPLTEAVSLKGGYTGMCALKSDATLWCWGANGSGQLGQGTTTTSTTPRQVKDSSGTGFLQEISDFAVGDYHACAITGGEVYCWGRGYIAGLNHSNPQTLPRHLPELSGAKIIEAGDHHSCALLNNNEVYCWGSNRSSQIGGDATGTVIVPRKISLQNKSVKNLALGSGNNPSNARSCVIFEDGEVNCWGAASFGVFGSSEYLEANSFVVQPGANVKSLSIEDSQVCLNQDDRAYASGVNDYEQFLEARYVVDKPIQVAEEEIKSFTCSRYSHCLVTADHRVKCQGYNFTGLKELTAYSNNVDRIGKASHSICALKFNGDLYCSGRNSNGAVGNGLGNSTVSDSTPYLTMTDVMEVKGGENLFCAIKTDKTVWCWGANAEGAAGNGTLGDNVLSPVQVQGLPDLSAATNLKLDIEIRRACLLAQQKVYCWGEEVGNLLNLPTEHAMTAQEITPLGDKIKHMTVFWGGVCASYEDNSISCLSYNSFNNLPSVFPFKKAFKRDFGVIGEIKQLEGGKYMICALLTSGQYACLGNNSLGGLAHEGIKNPLQPYPVKWY